MNTPTWQSDFVDGSVQRAHYALYYVTVIWAARFNGPSRKAHLPRGFFK